MKLMTFIGAAEKGREYKEADYKFNDGKIYKERIFPVALLKYLLKNGEIRDEIEIIILVTPEIEKGKTANLNLFEEKLKELKERLIKDGIDLKYRKVLYDWKEEKDLWKLLDTINKNVKKEEELIIDITHSFRFIPYLVYLILEYIGTFKNIKIKGIYYGNFEASRYLNQISPVYELSEFFKLSQWISGVNFFKQTGNFSALDKLMEEKRAELWREMGEFFSFKDRSRDISRNLINLDWKSLRNSIKSLNKLNKEKIKEEVKSKMPQAVPLVEEIFEEWKSITIAAQQTREELTKEHLLFQLEILRWYKNKNYDRNFIELFREFIVNCWLFINEVRENWLKEKSRKAVEEKLSYLIKEKIKEDPIPFIAEIFEKRNSIAHALMKEGNFPNVEGVKKDFDKFDLDVFLENLEKIRKKYCPNILITPLGQTIGLLYTLFKKFKFVDKVFIISSEEVLSRIEEIKEKADFKGEVIKLSVKDPFWCIEDYDRIKGKILSYLPEKGKVDFYLCHSGGTTALRFLILKMKEEFEAEDKEVKLKKNVKSFVAIDRRSKEEQIKNPFIEGEIRFLEIIK